MEKLRAFDTPTVCNALEIVDPGRRAVGFTTRPFVTAFPAMAPVVGYAKTAVIRARERPKADPAEVRAMRLRYYEYVAAPPVPSLVVIEDRDPEPGYGAFWGEVNTALHKGLGVLGCITSGSIRDLDLIATDFQLLAGSVAPSHAGCMSRMSTWRSRYTACGSGRATCCTPTGTGPWSSPPTLWRRC